MTTYYIDGGRPDDTGNGLTIATAKKTLNGAEDVPVVAGDLVHVRQGTYRELLTVDVSGTAGNPIEYRGDYTGVIFGDAFGGIVRVTGSDNDQTGVRANCIIASAKNYRTFTGFLLDSNTAGPMVSVQTASTNWIIQQCVVYPYIGTGQFHVYFVGAGGNHTIQNCVFFSGSGRAIAFLASAGFDNSGNLVQNCIILGPSNNPGIGSDRVGGITIKNCIVAYTNSGIRVTTALNAGQTITVNNCLLVGNLTALQATIAGEITENYNNFSGNATDRTNTNTGANSIAYPQLFDPRWAFQLMFAQAAAQLVSPFDLASFSQLVNLAGTSPTTTDLRGQAILGAQREWGALEYNSDLKISGKHAFARYLMGLG
mgnify:CR=1 FL=1